VAGRRRFIEPTSRLKEPNLVRYSGWVPQGNPIWNGGIPMMSLTKKVQRFLVSEDGPTAVEYAVMMALIVIVCLTAISAVGTAARTQFQKVGGSIASAS
jgi:pilus assembly protein Flp/PilA